MTKSLSTMMAIILLMACNTQSPKVLKTNTPIDLAHSIFDKTHLSDLKNYATGEYDGSFSGKDLDDSIARKFTLLEQKEKTAVVAMTLLSPSGKGEDLYLHFEKDTIWRVTAIRALAMTGMIAEALKEIEKLTPQQVNDAIKKGQFTSKEEYDFDLGNSRLTLALDDTIIKHFETHKEEFERIKNAALEELKTKTVNEEQNTRLVEKLKADYRKLLISSVYWGDYEVGGNCISFTIGGMIDNTVGYLYAADKKDLPEMNPRRLIMLREIGDGWYLYKTT